jgi:hypothetical protein
MVSFQQTHQNFYAMHTFSNLFLEKFRLPVEVEVEDLQRQEEKNETVIGVLFISPWFKP